MRCLSCDKRLNDRESVRKYATSGTFVDLCDRCFSTVSDEIPDVEGEVSDGGGSSGEEYDDRGWTDQDLTGDLSSDDFFGGVDD